MIMRMFKKAEGSRDFSQHNRCMAVVPYRANYILTITIFKVISKTFDYESVDLRYKRCASHCFMHLTVSPLKKTLFWRQQVKPLL